MRIDARFGSGAWRTSSFCATGECVEVAAGNGMIWVRSSNEPSTMVHYTPEEWLAFLAGSKAGEFDDVINLAGVASPTRSGSVRRTLRRRLRTLINSAQSRFTSADLTTGTGGPNTPGFMPDERLARGPENFWDFADRQNIRATISFETLELQALYEIQQGRREWGATMRHLVSIGGPMILGIVVVYLLISFGLSLRDAASITASGMLSGSGGYGLRLLVTQRRGPGPRRDARRSEKHHRAES